jgi:hypothetical protein
MASLRGLTTRLKSDDGSACSPSREHHGAQRHPVQMSAGNNRREFRRVEAVPDRTTEPETRPQQTPVPVVRSWPRVPRSSRERRFPGKSTVGPETGTPDTPGARARTVRRCLGHRVNVDGHRAHRVPARAGRRALHLAEFPGKRNRRLGNCSARFPARRRGYERVRHK